MTLFSSRKSILNTCHLAGILLCTALFIFPAFQAHAQVINTVAGNGYAGYYGDNGPATAAALDSPGCVVVDAAGNIYISDQLNNCIRKVTTSGIITTIAGTGTPGYNGDNIAATSAQLSSNWAVAVDASGNVYISDQGNNRIRKVNTAGIITTIAGDGTAGFYGDGGPATMAMLNNPIGISVDGSGSVYVGDANNRRVRCINTSGVIRTIAGNGASGYSGDGGPATAAQLQVMWGLASDAAGNVYICDAWNNRVRKVDPAPGGLISTVAGDGDAGFGGDGSAATNAQLNLPTGVYVNGGGELFIADCKNNRVRKVNTGGIISTIAGTGTPGFSGDDGLALNAELYRPLSVYGDGNGGLYIADVDNVRIRKISTVSLLSFTCGHNQTINACKNMERSLDSAMAVRDYVPGGWDTWSVITAPLHGDLEASYDTLSTGGKVVPHGLSYTPATGYTGNDVFIVRVTNGTVSDTTTVSVSVTTPITSAGIISGPSVLCVGAAITLTNNLAGGTWSCNNAHVQLLGSDNSTTVSGVTAGKDTVFYILSNGCSADTATRAVEVFTIPDAGAIAGPTSVCVGDSIMLTDAATGGSWASLNGAVTVSAGMVSGQHAGPAGVIYIVGNAGCADTAFYVVHVDNFPQPPVISGPGNVCVGQQVAMDGGLVLGTWSSDMVSIATVELQTGLVQGVSPGSDSIRYSISNSCGVTMAARGMTVDPLPEVPEIIRKENVLWVHGDYAAYQWTISGAAIAGANTDTFIALGSGEYGVIVTSALGCSSASQPYTYPGCGPDDLEMYPNPVQTTEYLVWCDKITVRVATADGRVILTAEDTNSVDMSGLPGGVYLLTVYDKSGKKVKTKRITKVTK